MEYNMQIVLNNLGVVLDYGKDNYEYTSDNALIGITSGDIIVKYLNTNNTNSRILEYTELLPQGFAVGKYKWNDQTNLFVLNELYVDQNLPNLPPVAISYEREKMLDNIATPPKNADSMSVTEKAKNILKSWLIIKDTIPGYVDMTEELANGIRLIDVENGVTPDIFGNVITLSANQILWRNQALNMYNKLVARYKIEAAIGDPYDLIADLSKQLNVLTGLVVRLYRHTVGNIPIPDNIKNNYDTFSTNYAGAVDAGLYKDRSDLEDPTIMIATLMERNNQIADIVKTQYLDKKL